MCELIRKNLKNVCRGCGQRASKFLGVIIVISNVNQYMKVFSNAVKSKNIIINKRQGAAYTHMR